MEMNAHAETLQRNLSIMQAKDQKQKAEINRLTLIVAELRKDKAALLADIKWMRGEK